MITQIVIVLLLVSFISIGIGYYLGYKSFESSQIAPSAERRTYTDQTLELDNLSDEISSTVTSKMTAAKLRKSSKHTVVS